MDKIKLDRNLFEVMEKITKEGKKKENLEKILSAYIFGYEEEEDDKYTIVLFVKDGWEFVLWEIEDEYVVDIREAFNKSDSVKHSFTQEEILNKFPNLLPLARKNK